MARTKTPDILVDCPCCGTKLTVDPALGKVIAYEAPPKQATGPDLDHAGSLLKEAAARREALFKQSSPQCNLPVTMEAVSVKESPSR